jgi:hypothetical protein
MDTRRRPPEAAHVHTIGDGPPPGVGLRARVVRHEVKQILRGRTGLQDAAMSELRRPRRTTGAHSVAERLRHLRAYSPDDLRRARRITGKECPCTPMGRDPNTGECWILDAAGCLRRLAERDLRRYRTLELICGRTWLRARYPVRWKNGQATQHFDAAAAADALIAACQTMGPFVPPSDEIV